MERPLRTKKAHRVLKKNIQEKIQKINLKSLKSKIHEEISKRGRTEGDTS